MKIKVILNYLVFTKIITLVITTIKKDYSNNMRTNKEIMRIMGYNLEIIIIIKE